MNKLKVVIVDDEMLIRKLIRMKLEALDLDVDIAGEFGDTKSAMEGVDELKPDIILSDICMPGEDGISFSEMCIQKRPELKIVIITGFNDFDYARRSLKAGVFDYLMKPVKDDELSDTIRRAKAEIEKERSEKETQNMLRTELENNLPTLRNAYINKLLAGEEAEVSSEKLRELGITNNRGANAGLRLGILAMRESIDNPNLPILVEAEVCYFFKSEKQLFTVRDPWGRVIIVSNAGDFPMEQCLELLVEMLGKKFGCHIISASSDVYSGFDEIRSAYKNALQALVNLYVGKNENTKDEVSQSVYSGLWTEFNKLAEAGKTKDARGVIEGVLANIEENASMTILYQRLTLAMRKLCKDGDIEWQSIEKENRIENYHTREELVWWLNERITRLLLLRRQDEQLELVKQTVDYIDKHIENALLNQNNLASKFGVSSSHLSRLMKQYVGATYGDIHSGLRLSKMLELINNTNLKDRDIGEKIGIYDAHYLSIWFRKMTGCSVSEYRKKYNL